MEFAYTCKHCGHHESWDSDLSCELAALWHLYDMHRGLWEQNFETDPTQVGRPEQYGSRYDDGENQV